MTARPCPPILVDVGHVRRSVNLKTRAGLPLLFGPVPTRSCLSTSVKLHRGKARCRQVSPHLDHRIRKASKQASELIPVIVSFSGKAGAPGEKSEVEAYLRREGKEQERRQLHARAHSFTSIVVPTPINGDFRPSAVLIFPWEYLAFTNDADAGASETSWGPPLPCTAAPARERI